ncbi:hypothetical protein [Erwinia sp. ErVv1]|uniref:hypothetical protein n=1 Tax=Erwinia sp. ErVv1 TaxID=1603299 RepID=UPI0008302BC2|nr:hypothetical protein [Erwinia sp. ErVv1]
MIDLFKKHKPSATIVRVEEIDENGKTYDPPQYEYWVIVKSSPPKVLSVAYSFDEALDKLNSDGYSYIL